MNKLMYDVKPYFSFCILFKSMFTPYESGITFKSTFSAYNKETIVNINKERLNVLLYIRSTEKCIHQISQCIHVKTVHITVMLKCRYAQIIQQKM